MRLMQCAVALRGQRDELSSDIENAPTNLKRLIQELEQLNKTLPEFDHIAPMTTSDVAIQMLIERG